MERLPTGIVLSVRSGCAMNATRTTEKKRDTLQTGRDRHTFRDSSAVERSPVKRVAVGSNPTLGAKLKTSPNYKIVG